MESARLDSFNDNARYPRSAKDCVIYATWQCNKIPRELSGEIGLEIRTNPLEEFKGHLQRCGPMTDGVERCRKLL